VARGIIGEKVVNSLATTEAVRPAAQAAWSIGTSVLKDVAWSAVFIGVPVILAGLLAGPTKTATRLRHLIAPYLRDRPDITFGAVGLLLLLLLAWGPIAATRTWSGILIIIVLVVFGAEMLRRQTAKEFPDAHVTANMLGGGGHSVHMGHHDPAATTEPHTPSASPAATPSTTPELPQSHGAATPAPPSSRPERGSDETPRSDT
jgi:hypothetical protein